MDWLNIHRSTLAAEQFLGCEPIQRATWLCLMAYCADQENGGRIEGASEWNDRKWQHVVRVAKGEVSEVCPLWSWEGGAVVVWAYPAEKEAEVRRNRENGGKGGRPPKPAGNQVVTSGLTQMETQTKPTAPISAETEEERNGKERKEKRRGTERNGASTDNCLSVYEAYPKKAERPEALKEIAVALKTIAYVDLLAAVTEYAAAVNSWPDDEKHFAPSCGRWMKRQRWLDDRKTWIKKPKTFKNGVQHNGFAETDYTAGLDSVPSY